MRYFLHAPGKKKPTKTQQNLHFCVFCVFFFFNFKINFCTTYQKKFSLPRSLRIVAARLKGSAKQEHSRLKYSKKFQIIGTITNS